MLLAILRIGIVVRLIVEPREFPLLERIAIVCCHLVPPFVQQETTHIILIGFPL